MTPGLIKQSGADVAAPGLSMNPVMRAGNAAVNATVRQSKVGLYQGTKKVAEWAFNRLANSGLTQGGLG